MKPILGLVLLSSALIAVSGGAAGADDGTIYECKDSDGQTVYQDEPCLEVTSAPPVAPRYQAPPKPPPAKKPRRTAPPPSRVPVDVRWATPENTLKTFVGAVTAGDRDLVLACLTSSALADLGPNVEGLPLEKLRETVRSFTGYVTEGDLGPFWSIRAKRAGLRPKWIFFERTGTGEWKIAAI